MAVFWYNTVMYRRLIGLVLLLSSLLPLGAHALEAYDTSLIYRNLQIISNHVNNIRDSDGLESIMAKGKDGLLGDINKKVANKTVRFTEKVVTITEIDKDRVRVEGTFEAEGNDGKKAWKNDGRNYFVFERKDNKWLLADTDFYRAFEVDKKSGGGNWLQTLLWLLALAGLVSLWFGVLKPSQRKAISRRVWLAIAAIWAFVARLVRNTLHKRKQKKQANREAEPEIIEETPMDYEEPMESAAPSPHVVVEEPDVPVHHFQTDERTLDLRRQAENKLDHNLDEEKD
jgi:hypothetical protein